MNILQRKLPKNYATTNLPYVTRQVSRQQILKIMYTNLHVWIYQYGILGHQHFELHSVYRCVPLNLLEYKVNLCLRSAFQQSSGADHRMEQLNYMKRHRHFVALEHRVHGFDMLGIQTQPTLFNPNVFWTLAVGRYSHPSQFSTSSARQLTCIPFCSQRSRPRIRECVSFCIAVAEVQQCSPPTFYRLGRTHNMPNCTCSPVHWQYREAHTWVSN